MGGYLISAARAAVPAVTPSEAADLVAKSDAVVVDVRDGTEVAASGKVKGALTVSRGS
jgi:rhodanese-related sulfurtransferase